MKKTKMYITGPYHCSEWIYNTDHCQPKRIVLLGEEHRKAVCNSDDPTTMRIPIAQFLSRVLRDRQNKERFAMDLFLESPYVYGTKEKATFPRGQQLRKYIAQRWESSIVSIQQEFKQELKTVQKVQQGFRVHYVDYRRAKHEIPIPEIGNEPWASVSMSIDRIDDWFVERKFDLCMQEITIILHKLSVFGQHMHEVVRSILGVWTSNRVKRQYPDNELREKMTVLLTNRIQKYLGKFEKAFGTFVKECGELLEKHPHWKVADILQFKKPWNEIVDIVLDFWVMVMDMYAVGRILRCFKEHREKPSIAFVYAGGTHIENYESFFHDLGLQKEGEFTNTTKDLCIPMDALPCMEVLEIPPRLRLPPPSMKQRSEESRRHSKSPKNRS